MRILHPSQVGYIQQANSTNTTISNSTTSTKGNDIIGHLPTTGDYSTNLSNLNGNSNDGKYSYGFIDADDNVNVTISPSQNLSARYVRNTNQYANRTEANSEILCNNLNQLNNLKSNNTEQKLNGNDNDIRQIFEGSINVFEIDEESLPKRLPSFSDSSILSCLDKTRERSISNSKSTSGILDEEERKDETEEEDLESFVGPNLICNENHLNKTTEDVSRHARKNNRSTHKVTHSGDINLSPTKLRQNLAKLDLETNLQNSFQDEHRQQHFVSRENQSDNTYKRGTSVSPSDHRSRSGLGSGYSSGYSCVTSPDDSFMEDEDAYSPSPSSSTSLTSPELSNFPRGIINPNYPGFQHLAHTLSEHFVNQSDADDSDLSEFEVELSVESLDESFEQFHSNHYNNNNIINNNNNDSDSRISELSHDSVSPHDDLNYNLEKSDTKEIRDHKTISLSEIRESFLAGSTSDLVERNQNGGESATTNVEQSRDAEGGDVAKATGLDEVDYANEQHISCELDTCFNKYATPTDVRGAEGKISELDNTQDEWRSCPTPDILIKNEKTKFCRQKTTENKPDLLKNVNMRPESINFEKQPGSEGAFSDGICFRVSVPDNIPIEGKRQEKEDSSYGVTPVDIIGDFGGEVEREFGLIVSGYNTRMLCQDYSPTVPPIESRLLMKTADALLSDGKEQLSVGSGMKAVSLALLQSECSACDLLLAGGPEPDDHRTTEEKSNSPGLEQDNLKNDSIASPKVIPKNNSAANKNNSSGGAPIEKLIPTAIVKPKYQKSSYDDRQLPPVGLGYCDNNRAWYEGKCSSQQPHTSTVILTSVGASGSDQRSRKAHQQFATHMDRNAKFSKKIVGRANGNSGMSQKLPNSRKDSDGSVSVVAVVTPRKKDKMESGFGERKCTNFMEKNNNNSGLCTNINNNNNLKAAAEAKKRENMADKKSKDQAISASFDVYNIETALPVIDLEAIETHLKKAKEEERKRRNDREEIRRRLAMGAEDDYFNKIVSADRPGRKPSLQSRLQSGMNLQICFMNEASSDTESPSSDSETCPKLSKCTTNNSNISRYSSVAAHPYNSRPLSVTVNSNSRKSLSRPSTLSLGPPVDDSLPENDFFTKQARLQIEARMALAQAKDMAHMQMEIERQKQKQSPITEVIRNSLEKVGVPFPPEKRRVSRQMLTDMNIAQLQIIVNELHTQIERLNEHLVQFLMERDELHMSQDSMLVDIEDLTRYLGAKEQSVTNGKINTINSASTKNSTKETHMQEPAITNNATNTAISNHTQSKFQRIASLVKK